MRAKIALACSLVLAGCGSTTYTLSPISVGQQHVEMNRGVAMVWSAWRNSTVVVEPANADLKGGIQLFVALKNTSGQSADLGTENVAVSFDGLNWKPAHTYEQLRARVDSNAAWASFGAAALGGLSIAAASQAGQYQERGVVFTPYGSASYTVNGVDRGEQLAAMNSAAAAAGQVQRGISARHRAEVAKLDAEVLRATTVKPGGIFGGLVVADAPELDHGNASMVLVRVMFLNDAHIIEFQAHQPGAPFTAVTDFATYPALAAEATSNITWVPSPSVATSVASQDAVAPQASSAAAPQENPASSPSGFRSFDDWQTKEQKSPAKHTTVGHDE